MTPLLIFGAVFAGGATVYWLTGRAIETVDRRQQLRLAARRREPLKVTVRDERRACSDLGYPALQTLSHTQNRSGRRR